VTGKMNAELSQVSDSSAESDKGEQAMNGRDDIVLPIVEKSFASEQQVWSRVFPGRYAAC